MTRIALIALLAGTAHADILSLDPGAPTDYFLENAGTGRSIYLTANDSFSIDAVGIFAPLRHRSFDVVINQGQGVTAPAGGQLAIATGIADAYAGWHDLALDFTFDAGSDYIITWRPTDLSTDWVLDDELMPYYVWGDPAADDVDLGLVTIRDGREGFDAFSYDNTLAPQLRLSTVPAPAALSVIALATPSAFRRRRIAS